MPYLHRELRIVQPRLVMGLGDDAELTVRLAYPGVAPLQWPVTVPATTPEATPIPALLFARHPRWVQWHPQDKKQYVTSLADALRWGFRIPLNVVILCPRLIADGTLIWTLPSGRKYVCPKTRTRALSIPRFQTSSLLPRLCRRCLCACGLRRRPPCRSPCPPCRHSSTVDPSLCRAVPSDPPFVGTQDIVVLCRLSSQAAAVARPRLDQRAAEIVESHRARSVAVLSKPEPTPP
jgi:hypothetical protein